MRRVKRGKVGWLKAGWRAAKSGAASFRRVDKIMGGRPWALVTEFSSTPRLPTGTALQNCISRAKRLSPHVAARFQRAECPRHVGNVPPHIVIRGIRPAFRLAGTDRLAAIGNPPM